MVNLIQIIATDNKNIAMTDNLPYSLDLTYLNMIKKTSNINNEQYLYYENKQYDIYDSYKIQGIIFELDNIFFENTNICDKIILSIIKSKLNIYTILFNHEQIDTGIKYFIGSIPLYLSNVKYYKNKIILTFPKNYFNKYNYFLKCFKFEYELVIPYMEQNLYNYSNTNYNYDYGSGSGLCIDKNINKNIDNNHNYFTNLIKNIKLHIINKILNDQERKILFSYTKFFSYNPIQFCSSIEILPEYINVNQIKIPVSIVEKIRGFFIYIPNELDGYIDMVVFNFNNIIANENSEIKKKTINFFDNNSNSYIFKQNDFGTIYWIGINNLDTDPFDHDSINKSYYITNKLDYVQIYLDPTIVDLDNSNNYLKNVSMDILVSNILIGSNNSQKLLYNQLTTNSELNQYEIEQLELYEKYTLDEKIKNIIKIYMQIQKHQTYNEKKKNEKEQNKEEQNEKEQNEKEQNNKYYNDSNLKYLAKKYIELY